MNIRYKNILKLFFVMILILEGFTVNNKIENLNTKLAEMNEVIEKQDESLTNLGKENKKLQEQILKTQSEVQSVKN